MLVHLFHAFIMGTWLFPLLISESLVERVVVRVSLFLMFSYLLIGRSMV